MAIQPTTGSLPSFYGVPLEAIEGELTSLASRLGRSLTSDDYREACEAGNAVLRAAVRWDDPSYRADLGLSALIRAVLRVARYEVKLVGPPPSTEPLRFEVKWVEPSPLPLAVRNLAVRLPPSEDENEPARSHYAYPTPAEVARDPVTRQSAEREMRRLVMGIINNRTAVLPLAVRYWDALHPINQEWEAENAPPT